MNSEELLKSISGLLNKHKDFLNDNPEIFFAIENRLFKAIDEEDEDYSDDYEDQEDGYGEDAYDDMFDEMPSEDSEYDPVTEYQDIDEDDDAAKFIAEAEAAKKPAPPSEPDKEIPVKEEKKVSSSGYRNWEPKSDYKPDHKAKIDQLVSEGWSPREAERLVGQHEQGGDPRHSKIRPSEPSAKMLEAVKGHALEYLKRAERSASENADPRKNPVKYANAQNRKAHEEAHAKFSKEFADFKNSEEVKNLRGRDRHNAIKEFKSKFEQENPDYKEKAIGVAAQTAGTYHKAGQERAAHLSEGEQAIAQAGMKGAGSTSGEYSSAASGGDEGMTSQGAMQSAGGTQGESGGYSSGTIKDPSLHIAEQYPEYAAHLKEKHTKLHGALNPEQSSRLKAVQSIKVRKKGDI